MAAIKSYTDVEQSRILADILPLESADMHYHYDNDFGELESIPTITEEDDHFALFPKDFSCWSLAALLSVLPLHLIVNNQRYAFSMIKGLDKNGETYAIKYAIFNTTFYFHLTDAYDNPVDACVAMIIKLHELKRL
jgi:hypothetical protein